MGIYGVTAYTVSQRTREIGVRMALGARQADVSGLVLRQGFLLTGVGVAVGLAAAVGLTRLMSALLFGVSTVDPVTYGGVAVALAFVALPASYIPARRAASVDPIEALRALHLHQHSRRLDAGGLQHGARVHAARWFHPVSRLLLRRHRPRALSRIVRGHLILS